MVTAMMLAVGSDLREPWVDEPRCESCHTGDAVRHLGDDIRLLQAWDDDIDTATPRLAVNKRFAETAIRFTATVWGMAMSPARAVTGPRMRSGLMRRRPPMTTWLPPSCRGMPAPSSSAVPVTPVCRLPSTVPTGCITLPAAGGIWGMRISTRETPVPAGPVMGGTWKARCFPARLRTGNTCGTMMAIKPLQSPGGRR
jgi:hypothetical protein